MNIALHPLHRLSLVLHQKIPEDRVACVQTSQDSQAIVERHNDHVLLLSEAGPVKGVGSARTCDKGTPVDPKHDGQFLCRINGR